MTKDDQKTLEAFGRLVARLAPLESRRRVTYDSLMRATRLHERIAELRASASPAVRRQMRLQGWR